METAFKYDVFLSHSSQDKPAVRELAERLKADGLRVWFDAWIIGPDDPISVKTEEGLEQSRTLVLVMSANAFATEWVTLERHTVLFRDPTNAQRRFIPLRLDDTEIKDTLRQFAYVDWRQKSGEQFDQLLGACRPKTGITKLTLKKELKPQPDKVFTGHTAPVLGVTALPDGRRVVSGSEDETVRVWDVETGKCLAIFKGHTDYVSAVVALPDGRRVVSGSDDKTLRVWDVETGKCLAILKGHANYVMGLVVISDGRRIVSSSRDKTLRVWDVETGKRLAILKGHTRAVLGVAALPDGRRVVSGSEDETVRVWDVETGKCLVILKGHTDYVLGVAALPDGRRVVSGSDDKTLRVWDVEMGKCLAILKGHTDYVSGVVALPDGRRVVSGSDDKTLRVWDIETGKCLLTFEGHTNAVQGLVTLANGKRIVSGSADETVRIWELSPQRVWQIHMPKKAVEKPEATWYTNAKVLLVGDSGVGKSGLAIRLSQNRFEHTISTDGAWATQLNLPHETNSTDTEREIWLWDFAGQADYRLIHQLFMDETALAVFVFNPQSDNPFEGLGQWDRDLQRASRRPFRKLLVAGRCDRGGLMVSRASIDLFIRERGFAHYLETSAYTGDGCDALRKAIIDTIPWDDIPWTSSPRIFRLLKEEIVKLKDEGKVLLRVSELKQQLEMRLPGEPFTPGELKAVVGLLAGPGVVWQLEFGDFVLLQPDRINAYAAAVVRKVRTHTEEIGLIPEEDVLAGKLDYQDTKRLPAAEEQIVLRAMHQTFLERGLCLREPTDRGTLLIFPSYFKRERPELEGHPAVLVSYRFNGPLDEIYATLVVRLHHTSAFDKDQLWRYAADFLTAAGKRLGVKMTRQSEGTADIAVYFEPGVPDDTKVIFVRYVHEHLRVKAQDVIRTRHYVCPHCHLPVENQKAVLNRLAQHLKDIVCANCEKRVPFFDLIEQKFASEKTQQRVQKLEQEASIKIDNESRELILVGHAFAIAGEAGQIFRPTANSDWGIDGEIEFKNEQGEASGKRVYLQLKSGDSYLDKRKSDAKEIFKIKTPRHAEYWQSQAYQVMLVIRTSDGQIRWMNVTDYLVKHGTKTKQIVFEGEPFTALNVVRLRDKLLAKSTATSPVA